MRKNNIERTINLRSLLIVSLCVGSSVTLGIELYNYIYALKNQSLVFSGEDQDNVYMYKLSMIKVEIVSQLLSLVFNIASLFFSHVIWDHYPNQLIFTLVFYGMHYLVTIYPIDYFKRQFIFKKYPYNKPSSFQFSFPPKNPVLYIVLELFILLFEVIVSKMTCLFSFADKEEESDAELLTMDQTPTTDIPSEPDSHYSFSFYKSSFWIVHFLILAIGYFCLSVMVPNMVNNNGSFKRVKDEDLLKRIQKFTKRVNFPMSSLYTTITKDDPPNAFVLGIFEKRIIVTKALFEMEPPPELASIVAHEVGHWYHSDLISGYFMTIIPFLLLSIIIQIITHSGLENFGYVNETPICAVMLFSTLFFSVAKTFWNPFMNTIMRSFERRADCFSSSFKLPIGDALIGLSNLSSQKYTPSPLYRWYHYSHPTVPERLTNLMNCPKYNWGQIE